MNEFSQGLIDLYFTHLMNSYIEFMRRSDNDNLSDVAKQMIEDRRQSIRIDYASKYAKVVIDHSVHSFIQLVDDAKFKRGDILKPAGWKAPAKNFSRGNILTGDFGNITWTGA